LLVEVINEFFGLLVLQIAQLKFEFALLGPEHDRLAFHPANHVEGSFGLAAQGHLQKVFGNARFHRAAQFALDLEEAIGRTETLNALVRSLVVVILDPEFDSFARLIEAVELRAC
jgi:hypothetical protein